jgi:hypothetical protein
VGWFRVSETGRWIGLLDIQPFYKSRHGAPRLRRAGTVGV